MKTMGWFSAASLVGIALGVFLGGVLSDFLPARLGKKNGRRVQGLFGLPFAALTVTLAVATPNPVLSALLLAVAALFAAPVVSPAWALCIAIRGHPSRILHSA